MTVRCAALVCCVAIGIARTTSAQVVTPAVGQRADRGKNVSPADATVTAPDAASGDYVIGADDLLSVVFWRDQQLSGEVLVRPDGKISVPLLDDVLAAGLTPRQLHDKLVAEARLYMSEPVVTVVVKQINSRKVYITGQVVRPGQYPLTPSMNVLQLIATAGGLGDYAKPREIRVVRIEHGQTVSVPFDYEAMTKLSKKAHNVELKAGDTVIVP